MRIHKIAPWGSLNHVRVQKNTFVNLAFGWEYDIDFVKTLNLKCY